MNHDDRIKKSDQKEIGANLSALAKLAYSELEPICNNRHWFSAMRDEKRSCEQKFLWDCERK